MRNKDEEMTTLVATIDSFMYDLDELKRNVFNEIFDMFTTTSVPPNNLSSLKDWCLTNLKAIFISNDHHDQDACNYSYPCNFIVCLKTAMFIPALVHCFVFWGEIYFENPLYSFFHRKSVCLGLREELGRDLFIFIGF